MKFLVSHADDYGIESISVSGYNPLTGEGVRFQDVDYSKYDLVITNPPFGQFAEFIKTMVDNNLEFLVIGPYLAPSYKDVFPLFKNGKIWIGHARELSGFMRPDGTILSKKDPEGSNARASRWYTNLDVSCRHDKLIMTENYIEGKYPKILVFGGYFLGGKARNLGAKKFDFMENGFST